MKQCKNCFSTDMTYVTNYEHMNDDEEYLVLDELPLNNDKDE